MAEEAGFDIALYDGYLEKLESLEGEFSGELTVADLRAVIFDEVIPILRSGILGLLYHNDDFADTFSALGELSAQVGQSPLVESNTRAISLLTQIGSFLDKIRHSEFIADQIRLEAQALLMGVHALIQGKDIEEIARELQNAAEKATPAPEAPSTPAPEAPSTPAPEAPSRGPEAPSTPDPEAPSTPAPEDPSTPAPEKSSKKRKK